MPGKSVPKQRPHYPLGDPLKDFDPSKIPIEIVIEDQRRRGQRPEIGQIPLQPEIQQPYWPPPTPTPERPGQRRDDGERGVVILQM